MKKTRGLSVLIMVAMGMLLINSNIVLGASEPEVVINEFLPDPDGPEQDYNHDNTTSDAGDEFIELYNNGTTNAEVGGWHLISDTKTLTIDGNLTVPVKGFVYFIAGDKEGLHGSKWSGTWSTLSNTGMDSINLTNQDGTVIDSKIYTGSTSGKSWARIPDGTGGWEEADPTPGEPNNVVINIGTVIGNMTVPIRIYCPNASDIGSADINITYNSSVCVITAVTNGSFDFTYANLEQNETGLVRISAFQAENPGLNGSIILANLTFQSNGTSSGTSPLTSTLNLTVNNLTDATPECNDIPYTITNGTYYTFLNGDVSGDGEVTLFDAMYLAKHVIGITGFEDIVEAAADVNGNGEIEISDAMYLAKHVLGIPGFEELK